MKRIQVFKCEQCGSEYNNKLECAKHEANCTNRRYYIEREKARLLAYIKRIEGKGFDIGIMYDTTANRCLISILDVKQRKKHKN